MKQFNQFQENVAAASIKVGSKLIPKIPKLIPALKTSISAARTFYQSRKKNSGSNYDNLKNQQQAGKGTDLKNERNKKKGLYGNGSSPSVNTDQKPVTDNNPSDFKQREGKSPADFVRDLKKQKEKGK